MQCVCRYADAQIRSRSARCRRNSCLFTTFSALHDEDARCPLRRPPATGSGNQPRCMQILKMNMGDAETMQKRCTVTEDYEY